METWVDYAGKEWSVRDMASGHLRNSIRAIERMIASRFADHVSAYLEDNFESFLTDPEITRWQSSRKAMQRELAQRYAQLADFSYEPSFRVIRTTSSEVYIPGGRLSFSQARQLGKQLLEIGR